MIFPLEEHSPLALEASKVLSANYLREADLSSEKLARGLKLRRPVQTIQKTTDRRSA